ncbi:MAG: 3-hydroxybutyryl-CoA dehydrogenase [Desulfobacteraceae bacterium]|nr:3-hydroxybutyryl-CoA dehydrogenase [Desulfobacteraceae bacterium]
MEIKKVGVVGCGIMGAGIVQVCAQSGYQVIVLEVNDELLKKGLASINAMLTKGVDKGKISQRGMDATLEHIKGTTNTDDFSDCDLVIEAAAEDLEIKKKVFAELDRVCPKHTIFATNTSSLCVIEIAAATDRLDKVLGLHFLNPAPVMKLLEVVRTIAISDETLTLGKEFGESLGKTVVLAKDTPGFIVNRLLIPFTLNAIRMLEAGIATRDDIDNAVKLGLNHPMGPLQLADLIGLDTIYHAASARYEELKEPQHAPPPLLKRMVNAGWLGRKTGKGFYEYK